MNVKLLVGIALFLIGIATAVMGITGVGQPDAAEASIVTDNSSSNAPTAGGNLAIPVMAGLSLAVGGLLIGLSMGNWKHPRTNPEQGDEVVNPEGYQKMNHV